MKSLFLATLMSLSAVGLTGCHSGGSLSLKDSGGNPQEPSVQERNYQNISTMPLEKALPLKYTRLQLICQQIVSYAVWAADGKTPPTISTVVGEKQVAWDLLTDLKNSSTIILANKFPSLDYSYELDLSIQFFTSKVTAQDGSVLNITNGIRLVGAEKGHLVYLNSIGTIMTAESEDKPDSTSFVFESTSASVADSSFKLNKTDPNPGLSIKCALEAELYPVFASDSQPEPKN